MLVAIAKLSSTIILMVKTPMRNLMQSRIHAAAALASKRSYRNGHKVAARTITSRKCHYLMPCLLIRMATKISGTNMALTSHNV